MVFPSSVSELSAAKDILIQIENACARFVGNITLVRDCKRNGYSRDDYLIERKFLIKTC